MLKGWEFIVGNENSDRWVMQLKDQNIFLIGEYESVTECGKTTTRKTVRLDYVDDKKTK